LIKGDLRDENRVKKMGRVIDKRRRMGWMMMGERGGVNRRRWGG